jgi:hypothetical protein
MNTTNTTNKSNEHSVQNEKHISAYNLHKRKSLRIMAIYESENDQKNAKCSGCNILIHLHEDCIVPPPDRMGTVTHTIAESINDNCPDVRCKCGILKRGHLERIALFDKTTQHEYGCTYITSMHATLCPGVNCTTFEPIRIL